MKVIDMVKNNDPAFKICVQKSALQIAHIDELECTNETNLNKVDLVMTR